MTDANPSQPTVSILHPEDNENDHFLVKEMMEDSGLRCEFSLVSTREEFESTPRHGQYDLIISD